MEKVYFAYLDILGFKDLVANNDLETLLSIYSEVIDVNVKEITDLFGKVSLNGQDGMDPYYSKINSLIISDSILFWTNDNSAFAFVELIATVKFICMKSFEHGIPLRGAITYESLKTQSKEHKYNSNQHSRITVIGKSLVDAYTKEGGQEWAGCVIDDNCIEFHRSQTEGESRSDNTFNVENLIASEFIIKYLVPYKLGQLAEEYVIDWRVDTINEGYIRNSFSMHNKNVNNWAVEIKIRNTVSFLNSGK